MFASLTYHTYTLFNFSVLFCHLPCDHLSWLLYALIVLSLCYFYFSTFTRCFYPSPFNLSVISFHHFLLCIHLYLTTVHTHRSLILFHLHLCLYVSISKHTHRQFPLCYVLSNLIPFALCFVRSVSYVISSSLSLPQPIHALSLSLHLPQLRNR